MAYGTTGSFTGGELDLNPVIIANEILISSQNFSIHKRLVRNIRFDGPGMQLQLPQIDALSFATRADNAAQIEPSTPDINTDDCTVVQRVCDVSVSSIAEAYGAASAAAAIATEVGTAYAKAVDAQIATVIEAATGNDVDHNGSMTIDHAAEAYANLLADGAPPPYYLVLTPADWQSLYASNGHLVTAGNQAQFMGGPSSNYFVGDVAGFQTYVSPYDTRTRFYSTNGVVYVWKPVSFPGVEGGGQEMHVGLDWRPDYRHVYVYGTYVGESIVRDPNGTTGGWCGNIYNAA